MTREEAKTLAFDWVAAWNARDIERVLGFFTEEVAFTSPTALAVVGTATVRGKAALRAYWTTALSNVGTLKFVIDRVAWDAASRELAIVYVSDIDGRAKRVSENLTFDAHGHIVSAEVFHGVAVQ
jgi:ketosteroid isomerase-like protein